MFFILNSLNLILFISCGFSFYHGDTTKAIGFLIGGVILTLITINKYREKSRGKLNYSKGSNVESVSILDFLDCIDCGDAIDCIDIDCAGADCDCGGADCV